MTAELGSWIGLSVLPLARWRDVAAQVRAGVSPEHVLRQQCDEGARLSRRPAWANLERVLERARQAWQRAEAGGIHGLALVDPRYPAPLRQLVDPPPVLWVVGEPTRLAGALVAVVGSRAATPYAVSVAEGLAAALSSAGVTVVSGLARGVDAAAHRGALTARGGTVAVVGSGVDVIYPPEHVPLAAAISRSGALVSELLPGTRPRPEFFPRRNRLISGLSLGVVVVEAGERSGSLITARCALEQGRDVMAVPGNVLGGRNTGGHALLRDGARLVESAADVLDEVGLPASGDPAATGGRGAQRGAMPTDPILEAMQPAEPTEVGDLAASTGQSPSALLARLLELELAGWVVRAPGGRFVRFDRPC